MPSLSFFRKHHLLTAFVGYLALAVAFTWPLALNLDTRVAGVGGDAFQNLWNIWWVKSAIFSGQSPYFSDLILHPTGTTLYLHTLTPYNGLVSAPFQLFLPLTVVYNLLCLFAIATAGLGMYLLVSWLAAPGTRLIPFCAGAIYALCPYEFAHLSIGHLNLISIQWLPFYIWALLRAISPTPDDSRRGETHPPARGGERASNLPFHFSLFTFHFKWIMGAALFLILTALCDWQYGFYLAILSGPLVVWRAVVGRSWAAMVNAAAIALLAGAILTPIALGLLRESGSGDFIPPPTNATEQFSADLAAFFIPGPLHPVWGAEQGWWDAHFKAGFGESPTYLGYLPLLLAVIALALRWRQAWFWLVVVVTALFVSLGPKLHVAGEVVGDLPYFLNRIPALSMYRMPVRFVVVAMLGLAVLAGLGLAAVLVRRSPKVQRVVAGLALLIVVVEYLPAPFPTASTALPAFYSQIAQDKEPYAVVELPINLAQGRYVHAQTVHQHPLIGGYLARFRYYPLIAEVPGFRELNYLNELTPDIFNYPVEVGRAALRYYDVRYLIVRQAKFSGRREQVLQQQLATLADPQPIYRDEQITVYRVRSGTGLPFLTLGDGWGGIFGGPGEGDGTAPTQRAFNGNASLRLHALQGGSYDLSFDAQAVDLPARAGGLTVRVELDGKPLIAEEIAGGATRRLHVPLILSGPGEAGLRLYAERGTVVVSSVQLTSR